MIQSREDLKQYALRALGDPVLDINVADEQLEDRLDEALEYWHIYHPDGIERTYAKYTITATELSSASAIPTLTKGTLTGLTSGATTQLFSQANNSISVWKTKGTFQIGEQIQDQDGNNFTLSAVVIGSWDQHRIPVPNTVYGVNRILPLYQSYLDTDYLFNIKYQLRMNELWDLASTSIIYYDMAMRHLSLLDMELNTKPTIEFSRAAGYITLEEDWTQLQPGQVIIAEVYRILDPANCPMIYNDQWLRSYTIALFKRQWAINLKKFSGIQLPGGVTLDGIAMYQEAMQEIKELETDLQTKAAPLSFFVG